jgi:NAD(P)-dependent dehydrogenase (short-subunit alcohol dehydrogenase family)
MSKVWLVTGSASGLGRDIAEAVLGSGNRLVATARNPKQLADLVDRYGDKVRAVALDVTDAKAAKSAVQVAIDAFGRLDVVVNNAGFAHIGPFEEIEPEDFRAQIETNLFGVVNVTRAALAPMRLPGREVGRRWLYRSARAGSRSSRHQGDRARAG